MAIVQKITPCLWFDNQAEDAAKFYVSIFKNSGIETVTRYGKEGFEKHGKPEGSVLTVTFRLEGQIFTALNGGPNFTLSPAISFVVHCESQAEVSGTGSARAAIRHGRHASG
jgi:predicted 3-demethylubiquinone-9 3-methyltransferase (glyoxalase superfamily)